MKILKNDRKSINFLNQWFKKLIIHSKFKIAISSLSAVISGLLLIIQVSVLVTILDFSITYQVPRYDLLNYIILFLILISLRAILDYVSEINGIHAAEYIKYTIRKALLNRILEQNREWIFQKSSGELISSIIEQVNAMEGFFSKYLPTAINAVVLPLSFLILLFPISWVISLLLFITVPFIPIFMFIIGKNTESKNQKYFQIFSRLSGMFTDRLRGLDTLKMYGRANHEIQSVVNASENLRKCTMSVLKIAFLSSAILEFFSALSIAGVALYIGLNYLGFLNINKHYFNLYSGLFCLLIVPEIYSPLRKFAACYHDRAAAVAAAKQLEILFNGLPELRSQEFYKEEKFVENRYQRYKAIDVKVSNLSIFLNERSSNILTKLNFRIEPAQHIALMGSSGIGKTTLLKALSGLKDISGQINLNGVSLDLWNKDILYEYIFCHSTTLFVFWKYC
ncbi:MAG: ATP-binding cassette domain-containing protein [Bordetella sp.]|nr:MAG: ATP-binding cassette domain-containing protein [Bordetella sp.]